MHLEHLDTETIGRSKLLKGGNNVQKRKGKNGSFCQISCTFFDKKLTVP